MVDSRHLESTGPGWWVVREAETYAAGITGSMT
jgi:hypothetical protein